MAKTNERPDPDAPTGGAILWLCIAMVVSFVVLCVLVRVLCGQ